MGDDKKDFSNKKKAEDTVEKNNECDVSRRRFLIEASGGAIALTTLATLGLPATGMGKPKIEFVKSSCGREKKTASNILVAYASRCGTTGEVAEAIAKEICATGAAADVRLAEEVDNLSSYTAVVLGGAARGGKWLKEASKFVENHEEALSQMPVAYFMTCLQVVPGQPKRGQGASEDETVKQAKSRVLAYLNPVLKNSPRVKPEDIGIFAGVLDFAKLSRGERTVMKRMGFKEGDFRDWDAIKAWAKSIIR